MKRFAQVLAAAALASSIAPAGADDAVKFLGHTTASEKTVADVVQNLRLLGKGQLRCDTIDLIEAMKLPDSLVPDKIKTLAAPNPVTPEGWNTTFCGNTYLVLVALWPAGDGSTMFAVQLLGPVITAKPK